MMIRSVRAALLSSALLAASAIVAAQPQAQAQTPTPAPPSAAAPTSEISRAEKLLFMTDHVKGLAPGAKVGYAWRTTGTLGPAFDDRVELRMQRKDAGGCCAAQVDFLSGERRLALPTAEDIQGNPVLLHFLERDIREMNRITRGSQSYYRKRLRMALWQGAKVADATFDVGGRKVRGTRIEIAPFDDDPARSRYEAYARKTYRFDLSDAVPGGVVAIRSTMRDADDAKPPKVVDELRLDGAAPSKDE